MLVLGIDPGSRVAGYGVIEKKGSSVLHIDNGCIRANVRHSIPKRLEEIYLGIVGVLKEFGPDVVAIEEVFFAKNVSSSLRLGESRGVILLAATQRQIPIFEYSTRGVKQAVTGYGNASKNQVQKMVQRLLALPEVAQEDASDALAIAICHAHSSALKERVA